MKNKTILNRPMFRQGKSPAYGTGISANLVSGEERQRYNYGGRVGYFEDQQGGVVYPTGVVPNLEALEAWENKYKSGQKIPEDPESAYQQYLYPSQDDLEMAYDPTMEWSAFDVYNAPLPKDIKLKQELIKEHGPELEEQIRTQWEEGPGKKYVADWEAYKSAEQAAGKGITKTEDQPTSLNELKMTKKIEDIQTPAKKEEVVEETNTIGLSEDEKNALLATGAFSGAAAAATSKGKGWQDVLGDAIGGVASGLGTGVNPAKLIQEKREQEVKYGEATEMYRTLAEEEHKRKMSDEFRIKNLVDAGLEEDDAKARIKLGSPIPKLNETLKKSIKKGKNPEMAAILKSGKPYFDEESGMYRVIIKKTGKEDFVDSIDKVIYYTEQGIIK